MDGVVRIDRCNDLQQVVLRGIGRQKKLLYLHTHLAAAGQDTALIGEVVLPFPHTHHGQGGSDTLCLELFA